MTAHAGSLAVRSLLRRNSLPAERERKLLRTYRASADEMARQQALAELWESHSRLVVAIAQQYRRPDIALGDLVGAAHLGLHAAIAGFDPDLLATRFSGYAIGWIRHYIQDYIRRHAGPLVSNSPAAHHQLARSAGRLFADARRSCQREGIEPTDAELCMRVAARMGLSSGDVTPFLSHTAGNMLHAPSADMEAKPLPDEAVVLHLDHAKLRRRVLGLADEILGNRERKVFLASCVSGDVGTRQRDTLAAELGITRERIYQLEMSARRKIAAALAHDGLLDRAPSHQPEKLRPSRRTARRVAAAPA